MIGILKQMDYSEYLRQQRRLHQRACDLHVKHCVQCGFCCMQRPCVLLPKEIKPIADFLRLSIKELINTYLVVDKYNDSSHFLMVAKETQMDLVGQFVSWERTYDEGYCCFFNKETHNCKIYPVRPKEARDSKCWMDNGHIIGSGYKWQKDDIYKFVPNFTEDDDEDY